MAVDRKISDLDNALPPQGGDYYILAREDFNNYKVSHTYLYNLFREDVVFTTGDQTIGGIKTFYEFIKGNVSGNLSGYARYVVDGVYTTGNQLIEGKKTFSEFIQGNVSGNLSGTARYVVDGVYTTGDQSIYGEKTFDSFIKGNVSGNLSGTARYVKSGVYTSGDQQIEGRKDFVGDLFISGKPFDSYFPKDIVYITGDQTIDGHKEFLQPITGDLTGTALYVKSGVYTSGNQEIEDRKDFVGDLFISGKPFDSYFPKDIVYVTGDQTIDGHKEFLQPITGDLTGTALYVTSGVYTSGNQEIEDRKDFVGDLFVSGQPFTSYIPSANPDIVYITGDQTIDGHKEFLQPITGDLTGTALYVTSGVYTSGNQEIEDRKDFVGDLFISGRPFTEYLNNSTSSVLNGSTGNFEVLSGVRLLHSSGEKSVTFTDGSIPTGYGEDYNNKLLIGFESGVHITGESNLYLENSLYISGRKFDWGDLVSYPNSCSCETMQGLKAIYSHEDGIVISDGTTSDIADLTQNRAVLGFERNVYLTGETDLYGNNIILNGNIKVQKISGELENAVYTTGDQSIQGIKNFTDEIYVSGKSLGKYLKHTDTIISNFWWSQPFKNCYIPISNAEHDHKFDQNANILEEGAGESNLTFNANDLRSNGLKLQHLRLMQNAGRVKSITFSITDTNPHAMQDVQFYVVRGNTIETDYLFSGVQNEFMYMVNQINEDYTTNDELIAEKTEFEYEEWEDHLGLYSIDQQNHYPCEYLDFDFDGPVGEKFTTPQKYYSYTYDFKKGQHFTTGDYLSIAMDLGGVDGTGCYESMIDQGIFVTLDIETFI